MNLNAADDNHLKIAKILAQYIHLVLPQVNTSIENITGAMSLMNLVNRGLIFGSQSGPQRIGQLEGELAVIKEDTNDLKQGIDGVNVRLDVLANSVGKLVDFLNALQSRSDVNLPPPPGSLTGISAPTTSMAQPSMSSGLSPLIDPSVHSPGPIVQPSAGKTKAPKLTASKEPSTPQAYESRSSSVQSSSSGPNVQPSAGKGLKRTIIEVDNPASSPAVKGKSSGKDSQENKE